MSNQTSLVTIDVTQQEPLRRIWPYVGYDEPNYTYTERGRELLSKLGNMADGPYFIRCHFILCTGDGTGKLKWGSTNAYTEDEQGGPVYDFSIIDRILDTYIETGCIPFVELGFMPKALSIAPEDLTYESSDLGSAWAYPPKDYGKWRNLIAELARHCVERYGMREVRRWYWELWNEPDIPYWKGTVEEFNTLYDYTEAGLHSVLPQAYVGGPATTSPAREKAGDFLRKFLEHCSNGTNAVTGERGTRLDYVSFHTKGGGYRRDDVAAKQTPSIYELVKHVAAGLEILGSFPMFKGLEVVLSECDPDGWAAGSIKENKNLNFRNTEYYASYLANTVCKLINLGQDRPNRVDAILTWAFQFENRGYFEGMRTLSTNGIDKPVLNVFRMLGRLGRIRLQLKSEGYRDPVKSKGADRPDTPPDVSGLAALDERGAVSIFLSCHHDDWDVKTEPQIKIQVQGLVDGSYRIRRLTIDEIQANAFTKWLEMERPNEPNADQLAALRSASKLECVVLDSAEAKNGVLSMSLSMKCQSVLLLELLREE